MVSSDENTIRFEGENRATLLISEENIAWQEVNIPGSLSLFFCLFLVRI